MYRVQFTTIYFTRNINNNNYKVKSVMFIGRYIMVTQDKSLKIPKRYSEAINRRTGNTMTKRNRTNNDLQKITLKTKH